MCVRAACVFVIFPSVCLFDRSSIQLVKWILLHYYYYYYYYYRVGIHEWICLSLSRALACVYFYPCLLFCSLLFCALLLVYFFRCLVSRRKRKKLRRNFYCVGVVSLCFRVLLLFVICVVCLRSFKEKEEEESKVFFFPLCSLWRQNYCRFRRVFLLLRWKIDLVRRV